MILIDPRAGSGELASNFKPYDIPIQLTNLDSGDFAFYGEGPEGISLIGFERKVISDLAQSKRSNRLHGFQLPNMSVDYAVSHLIVEGIYRSGETGLIEVRNGKYWNALRPTMMFREIDHFLAELAYLKGVFIERTADRQQTAAYVVSRYKFFNDQVWTQHDRTEKVFTTSNSIRPMAAGRSMRSGFTRRVVPALEKMLMQVQGVEGDATWVAKRYLTMQAFMQAGVEELAKVQVERNTKEGRKMGRLGPAKAEKMWKAVRE